MTNHHQHHTATAVALLLFSALPAMAVTHQVAGPDGKLVVSVADNDGLPTYSITYDGTDFLLPSPLGLVTDLGDYTKGLRLSAVSDPQPVSDSYDVAGIKKSHVDYSATRRAFTFSDAQGKPVFDVVMQVSDNDVALRYDLHPNGERRCTVVKSEATGFAMPDGTTTFLCPQSIPMGGFARTYPSYETTYTLDDTMGKNGHGRGYSFPCLFRAGDSGWILVSETGVDGSYCASRLLGDNANLYTIGYPQPEEMNGLGSVEAGINLPGSTPWRTITVGTDLAPIVETTVAYDVVSPLYEASQVYEPSRGSWSWIIKMDPSCNFDEQKRYIDFSADMGWETVLVDALWDTQIGYDRVEELARYAKSRGVDLYLWYNSNGYWNDAPQGPRGKLDKVRNRRKEMQWMKDQGIRGIKVDFFGGDKQQMMQLYEDILSDANDFGLRVIFHGCTLPRGWERMFPNFAAAEAVLASENLHFSQERCDTEALNACLHPFIRNTVAAMDFGGSALNHHYSADNSERGSVRRTSDVFALATAVLFQSPVQHFALAPNNLTDAPAWAIDFMKAVPTTWDDIRLIDGYPGRFIILARRHGDNWYLAGINAQTEPVKATLDLAPFFAPGTRLNYYSDTPALEGSLKEITVNKKASLKVEIPTNGAILLTTARPQD